MPGVLFLPDQFYDHRIWADLPASLGADCDAVCFDVHEPMPWEEPDSGAFLDVVRRLVPDPARTAVAAAGQAAGLAVQAARSGLAGGWSCSSRFPTAYRRKRSLMPPWRTW